MIKQILLPGADENSWDVYRDPLETLVASSPDEVLPVLRRVEEQVEARGLIAAGFVSYEAAAGFDNQMVTHRHTQLPLILFGLFASPQCQSRSSTIIGSAPADHLGDQEFWRLESSAKDHAAKLARIHALIGSGTVYQINHTQRLRGRLQNPWALVQRAVAQAPQGAYIDTNDFTIVSASPETFFSLEGDSIVSRPMKGTAARSSDQDADQAMGKWLASSTKNRAENLMITDMVRNDLGRIAEPGSVGVTDLFTLEKHPTVWQMTSGVRAQTQVPVSEIFRHLFPAASITGAPKHQAMSEIAKLEDSPREVYTGAIGFIAPGRRAHFNIAIRTAWLDKRTGLAEYGAGGGIVWDSKPGEEYQELLSKTKILHNVCTADDFGLFETMAWVAGHGVQHQAEHLARMAASARYFSLPFDSADAVRVLEEISNELASASQAQNKVRVRLDLHERGRFSVNADPAPISKVDLAQPVALAQTPVASSDPLLQHKTTQRQAYVDARRDVEVRLGEGVEPILLNEHNQVTETDIANVVYEWHGDLYTPPQHCGLLPGVLRAQLLSAGRIRERVLHADEIAEVDLYLVNDLRGWRRASLIQAQWTALQRRPNSDGA